jgi:hypothetical protein
MPWWGYAAIVGYIFGAGLTCRIMWEEGGDEVIVIFPVWFFWPVTWVVVAGALAGKLLWGWYNK